MMYRRLADRVLVLLLSVSTPGCGLEDAEISNGEGVPATRQVTPDHESGTETVQFVHYASPSGFALPFTAEIPADMEVIPRLEGEADALGFRTGAGSDSALVHVVVLPRGTAEDAAREIVRSVAERERVPGSRSELEPLRLHDWAVVEYPIRSRGSLGEPLEGWVALGSAGDRWYYIIAHAQASLWPRFSSRVDQMLASWEWAGVGGGVQ